MDGHQNRMLLVLCCCWWGGKGFFESSLSRFEDHFGFTSKAKNKSKKRHATKKVKLFWLIKLDYIFFSFQLADGGGSKEESTRHSHTLGKEGQQRHWTGGSLTCFPKRKV